jgi:hypothetical protein
LVSEKIVQLREEEVGGGKREKIVVISLIQIYIIYFRCIVAIWIGEKKCIVGLHVAIFNGLYILDAA